MGEVRRINVNGVQGNGYVVAAACSGKAIQ